MAHLTLVVQGREVRKFVLTPSVTTIGRAQDNDIVINNLALSRRHAEVHLRADGYQVQDLGSQNGVFVNNNRIRGPQSLQDEDTITLGTYHFVFADDEDRSRPPPPRSARRARRAQEVTQLEDPEDIAAVGDLADEAEQVPLLVLKYNDVELQRVPVVGAEVLVGRAKDCDIQIAERRLSRRHCKIFRDEDGYFLTDLGSQNGTYVNRRRIPQNYELRHGDLLNFAEYSILFLADAADYDGPDRDVQDVPAPRPSSGIEKEETEFPEAFADELGYDEGLQPSIIPREEDQRIHPSELTQDPDLQDHAAPIAVLARGGNRVAEDPSEPFVERPVRARERRKKQAVRDIQETGRRPGRDEVEEPTPPRGKRRVQTVQPAKRAEPSRRRERDAPRRVEPNRPREAPPPARRAPAAQVRRAREEAEQAAQRRSGPPRRPAGEEHRDIDDQEGVVRPDSSLDDWYDARDDSEIYQDEPSVLLERSKSSMSQLLSTMMVDKRDLDRNLKLESKHRQFNVRVSAGDAVVYEGPLDNEVTILGTDAEADIQLKGRYVAGRHSLLVRVRDSLLLVRLGSSSAARVNGLPKLQAFLKSGDVVQIDETTIEILDP